MENKDIKVLIAESFGYIKINIEKMLFTLNLHNVQHAQNGEDTLKMINLFHPDLLIIDLALGKVNDIIKFLKLILNININIKIIICLSKDKDFLLEQVVECGLTDFFYKPVEPVELYEVIKKNVEKIKIIKARITDQDIVNCDITKKFNLSLIFEQKLIIFNLFKMITDYTFNDLYNAIIAFQVYDFINVFLNLEKMSILIFREEDLITMKELIEGEGGKFYIVSDNIELNNKLINTKLGNNIVPTIAHGMGNL